MLKLLRIVEVYESKKYFNLVLLPLRVEVSIGHGLLEVEQIAVINAHLTSQFLLIHIRLERRNLFSLI